MLGFFVCIIFAINYTQRFCFVFSPFFRVPIFYFLILETSLQSMYTPAPSYSYIGTQKTSPSKRSGSSSFSAPNRVVQDVILEAPSASTKYSPARGGSAGFRPMEGLYLGDTVNKTKMTFAKDALAVDPLSRIDMEQKLVSLQRDIKEEHVVCNNLETEIEQLQQKLRHVRQQRADTVSNMENFLDRTKLDLEGLRREIATSENEYKELNARNERLRMINTL